MKRLLAILICIFVVFSIAVFVWAYFNPDIVASVPGFGTNRAIVSNSQSHPTTLKGSWTQKNSAGLGSYMTAIIGDDVIQVYWITDGGDSQSLYWWGSFDKPENLDAEYSWESINDHSKTDSSMLASSDNTKEFLYKNGELSFSASAMGTTKTVRMVKDK